jgi:hypothetical protein
LALDSSSIHFCINITVRHYLCWFALPLLACAPQPAGAPAAPPDRVIPFRIAGQKASGFEEYVVGTVLVYPNAVDVLVTSARLLPDTPQERIESVRAALVYGDTARSWGTRARSDALPIARLRALASGATSDTLRFRIPRASVRRLEEHFLAFELRGRVQPPGMPWGEAFRPLFGRAGMFGTP